MAGPGGGPPRRSHTKSRKGCEACKRRHIRCDENFPQCRNCTKHKVRCPYNDFQATDGERSVTPEKPDLMWTPEIYAAIANWQATGIFPFPSLGVYPPPMPQNRTVEELRLIYHLAAVYDELSAMNGNGLTLWTHHLPTVLGIAATHPYVMHAMLAFSAMHICFLSDCPKAGSLAFEYRGRAFSGLHEAIDSFSPETSDAILAASLVLSWQATDWSSWTQLTQGTTAVIDAMDDWKKSSQFTDFISESRTFPTAPRSPGPDHRSQEPSVQDLEAFQRTLEHVQTVEANLKYNSFDSTQMHNLVTFLKGTRKISHTLSVAEQYERMMPLRTLLFWLPINYLRQFGDDSNALLVIGNLYTVAMLMERLFPEIGAGYFGSLSIRPVEEIARRLFSRQNSGDFQAGHVGAGTGAVKTPLALMEFSITMLSDFRSRMGWVSPERTQSFPQFDPPNFVVNQSFTMPSPAEAPYLPYGNPAFSYSAEGMPMLNTSALPQQAQPPSPHELPSPYVQHAASPHELPSPYTQYLSLPSSSHYHVPHSPSSSTFEGSIAHSDTDELAQFTMSGFPNEQPQYLSGLQSSYGAGFVPPHQQQNASSATPPTYSPSWDPFGFSSSVPAASPSFLSTEHMGMLPHPVSPVPSSSTPYLPRHRQTASVSSGPHPASPLAQAPLMRSPTRDSKGKERAN